MISGIVAITTAPSVVIDVARRVADIPGVVETYSCSGSIDVLCILKVSAMDEIESIVCRRIAPMPGVLRTSTHVAYRAHSSAEATEAFSLGIPRASV